MFTTRRQPWRRFWADRVIRSYRFVRTVTQSCSVSISERARATRTRVFHREQQVHLSEEVREKGGREGGERREEEVRRGGKGEVRRGGRGEEGRERGRVREVIRERVR